MMDAPANKNPKLVAWLTSRLKDAGEVHHYESGEIERLRAALKEAVPYIEGAQNTTSVETFRAAASLLAKIQELFGSVAVPPPNDDQ